MNDRFQPEDHQASSADWVKLEGSVFHEEQNHSSENVSPSSAQLTPSWSEARLLIHTNWNSSDMKVASLPPLKSLFLQV